MEAQEAQEIMNKNGWMLFNSIVSDHMIESLRHDLEEACQITRKIQLENGIDEQTEGTAAHVICFKRSFLDFLSQGVLHEVLTGFFEGAYILNTYGGVKNLKNKVSYAGNIHRDIRSYSGEVPLMVNMLVMLDDFTPENGATYLLSGSHLSSEKPTDEQFFAKAERAIGKKGDIILFNANLWHAAGVNNTDEERRALTLLFTKPFMKQQLDYPRFFGEEFGNTLSDYSKQVLGYNSRVPSNLNEWYQPKEKRFYKSNQG
jgi:hypothetical protein